MKDNSRTRKTSRNLTKSTLSFLDKMRKEGSIITVSMTDSDKNKSILDNGILEPINGLYH